MVQASVNGAIDFQTANLQSPRWWRSLWLRLRVLASNTRADYYRTHAQFTLQLMYLVQSGSPLRKSLADLYEKLSADWHQCLFPWLEKQQTTTTAAIDDELKRIWAETFGDPNDPKVQARIAADVAALRKDMRKR